MVSLAGSPQFSGRHADGSYTPDAARAALALPAVAPVIIPPLVSGGLFGGLSFQFGHKITTAIGQAPNIADQDAEPTKPPDKAVSFSTYGVVIPISLGRRRLSGNVVSSTAIMSVMLGTYDYYVEYQIPITTTDTQYGSLTIDNTPDPGLDLEEMFHTIETERVFQNNDDSSPNYVDVARYKTITLTDSAGKSRTYTFQLGD